MATMNFTDLFNFRDVGGYPTIDGRTIVPGRLYRSDDLCRLDFADHDQFLALGIRSVIDLRRPTELAEWGRVPELPGVTYYHLHLEHEHWPRTELIDLDSRVSYLTARYANMAASGGVAIGAALRLIADAQAAPVVVHCLAGKDRTGIVVALALHLLGVSDEMIAQDYALSEASDTAWRRVRGKEPAEYVVSPAAAILGFLTQLSSTYGSVGQYAESVGVTPDHIAAMRAHLLA